MLLLIKMKQLFFALCVSLFGLSVGMAQKPFIGTLTYQASITHPDTNVVIKKWGVKIYTNDTVVRLETETEQFGTQVYIRNMQLNKAYLLLELEEGKYAIQTDLSKKNDSIERGYTVKKKSGSKKVAGLKAKRYWIQEKNNQGYDAYFNKKIANKYLQVYPEVPYLAVDYSIPSHDGLTRYELVECKRETVNRDLFGIPSDYKRISFEEFLKLFYGTNEQ